MGQSAELRAGQPIVEFVDREAFEKWLDANHDSPTGVWLKIAKKSAAVSTVTHPEALEIALIHGWIDGQRVSYDEAYFLQRFVRRTRRSTWSQINRRSAERLIAEGRMKPAGLEEVQRAKQDGRWEAAYPAQSAATVPPDLQEALDRHPEAREFFNTLTGSRRYAFLFRLHNVKRPETRAKRIERYIELLSERQTLTD